MYADFAFYQTTYLGTLVPDSDAFAALERQASLFLDRITFNRLQAGWSVTDAVKMADCAVVDELKKHESALQAAVTAAGLKSENVDGYSVSYQDAEATRASVDAAKLKAARPYLIYTGLMDRSVCI